MLLTLCKAKLHRLTVTQAELHYEGSITIDQDLLEAAGILPFEKVQAGGWRKKKNSGVFPRHGWAIDPYRALVL